MKEFIIGIILMAIQYLLSKASDTIYRKYMGKKLFEVLPDLDRIESLYHSFKFWVKTRLLIFLSYVVCIEVVFILLSNEVRKYLI